MRLVIIESPYAGPTPEAVAANVAYARACLLDSLLRGEAPIASHLLYTQVLDDTVPVQRALGIAAGLAWRKAVAFQPPDRMEMILTGVSMTEFTPVLPAFYVNRGMSHGMLAAAALYQNEGIEYETRRLPTGPIIEGARGLDAPGGTEP